MVHLCQTSLMTATRAAIYRRISDDREGRELGVTRQSEDLEAFARARGYTIVGDYADNDISASTRSRRVRPAYSTMLGEARSGAIDVILAATSGRLTRRPREFEDLIELAEQHGVRFEYLSSPSFNLNTADGRMIARMLAAADAAESERIGERVEREARQRAEQGRPPRGHALGYSRDGMTLEEPAATLVREAYEAVLAGSSLASVGRRWNESGLRTVHGNGWDAKPVRDVLRNPRYAGLVLHGGVELSGVEARWPTIVNEDVWRGVQAVLADPERRMARGTTRKYLLSGFATCGLCGHPLVSGGTRRGYRSLKCVPGRHLERVAEPIEQLVEESALARLRRPDAAAALVPSQPDLKPLRARGEALRAQRKALAADLDVDLSFAKARDRRLLEELTLVEAELTEATRGHALAVFVGRDPSTVWADLDIDQRRMVLVELFAEIVVLPPGRGARVFRPESVRLVWR